MLQRPNTARLYDLEWDKVRMECDKCSGTGCYMQSNPEDEFEHIIVTCECKKRVAFKAQLRESNVPVEFWDADGAEPEWNRSHYVEVRKYTHSIREAKRTGRGYLMVGQNGVGKTLCSCTILVSAIKAGYTAGYMTAHDFMATLPSTWSDPDLKDWFWSLARADFLVLDEVGKEYTKAGNDRALAEFDSLLRYRRGNLMPTVVVSNLNLSDFRTAYGESLYSILMDRLTLLQFAPGDFRKELRKQSRNVRH